MDEEVSFEIGFDRETDFNSQRQRKGFPTKEDEKTVIQILPGLVNKLI